jgi:hypothetical protein
MFRLTVSRLRWTVVNRASKSRSFWITASTPGREVHSGVPQCEFGGQRWQIDRAVLRSHPAYQTTHQLEDDGNDERLP